MFGRRKTTKGPDPSNAASAYRFEGRIVLEGSTWHETGAYSPADLLVSLEAGSSDEEIGAAVLSVLDQFGKQPQASSDKPLLKLVGVSSRTRLIRRTDAAIITRPTPEGEITMRPYRPHPPGGWTTEQDDPEFACDSIDAAAAGRSLRQCLDAAASFRPDEP